MKKKIHNKVLLSTALVTGICLGGYALAATESAAVPAAEQVKKDALWYLTDAQKPVFAKGNTLLPLTRWGWAMSYDVRVELAENWGYALELTKSSGDVALSKALSDPKSTASKIVALAQSDPQKYPLAVLVPRPLNDARFRATLPNQEQLFVHDADGEKFDAPQFKLYSPIAPDSIFEKVAKSTIDTLQKIEAKAPIAIMLDGGENGLSVSGHSQSYWSKDPKVVADKGDLSWYEYSSKQKGHQQGIITDAIRKAFPDRKLYIWYHFGFIPGDRSLPWTWDYKYMRQLSDMPDQSIYYKHYNSGWAGANDLLTKYLSSVALASKYGDPLSYNWVCAGWKEGQISDRDRYMGFLKCLYTGGQIGAVAGYFSFPKGGFDNPDLGDTPPSWLTQMIDLGRVQALFSHVEDFLRKGDLLPGPNMNTLQKDVPAYEFPTGDATARVLARRLRGADQWLITAWAADGPARDVTATIPDLGSITVKARPEGSVYRATLQQVIDYEPPAPQLELLDKDGMHPSAGFAEQ